MQEWLNWHAWKVCRLFTGSPGFESPSFRHELIIYENYNFYRRQKTRIMDTARN